MTLPSSGPLSLTDIQTEFGGSNPASLSEYYAGGSYVPAGTSGTYGAVPSSGTISIQNFYGTSAGPTYWIIYSSTGLGGANWGFSGAAYNGSLYLAGSPDLSGSTSVYNSYILKTSTQPSTITYTKLYTGGSGLSAGGAVRVNTIDFYPAVAGDTYFTNVTDVTYGSYTQQEGVLIKYNSSGTFQWARAIANSNFGTSGKWGGVSTYSLGSVGFFTFPAYATSYPQAVYASYEANGSLNYAKVVSFTSSSWVVVQPGGSNALAISSSGDAYVGVTAYNTSTGKFVPIVAVIGSTGNYASDYLVGRNNNGNYAYVSNVVFDSSGNKYVAFSMSNSNASTTYRDVILEKYTSGWPSTRTATTGLLHSGTDELTCYSIAIDSSNNIYVAANYNEYSTSGYGFIAKYNSSLTLQWQRQFTSTSGYAIFLRGIIVDSSSTFIATGYRTDASNVSTTFNIRLPTDGSKTGTYGNYTYSASSVTTGNPTYVSISQPTPQTSNLPANLASVSFTPTEYTSATLTSTITPI